MVDNADAEGAPRVWALPDPDEIGALPLIAQAVAIGGLVHVERATFGLVGRWSVGGDDAAASVWLSAVARHAAWRADELSARLPALRELTPAMLVVSPGVHVDEAFALADTAGPQDRIGVAAALLAAGAESVGQLAQRCRPVADRSLMRTLDLVAADNLADREAVGGLRESANSEIVDSIGRLLNASAGGFLVPGAEIQPIP